MSYFRGIGDGMSQLVGWALGYTDTTNQSISGKAFDDWVTGKRDWPRRWVNKLFRSADHCRDAWVKDEERATYEVALKKHRRMKYGDKIND